MKAPEKTTQEEFRNSSTNGVASSQKRRPPKLRPPKLAKRTTPSDRAESQVSEQRQIAESERSQSNSVSESINGITNHPSEDSLDSVRLEKPLESPQTVQQTRIRHESAPSTEPERVEVIEREQRSNSPDAQIRETRVRRMVSPEVKNKDIVRAPDPHVPGQRGELLHNGINSQTGQLLETTEAVTNTKGSDQLKLRLDLNLDVEIELKAKIRGDLTLQLLQ
ncbi:hypothetical protein N7490_005155 [Penicillium lividum]|nr:hypothetical protein N7490_005155 [Penicillium lividum]